LLKNSCIENCENIFSPNGDGISDSYFIKKAGLTRIYDRNGNFIAQVNSPGYWDGKTFNGNLATPGLFFVVYENNTFDLITLVY